MGSASNVLRKPSLSAHIAGLLNAGAFKSNKTVQPHTGWRTAKAYSDDKVTGHRATDGVGSRSQQAVAGLRDHGAARGSQAPKKNAVVGD